MTLTANKSLEHWFCYVCGKSIPEHEGLLHCWLGIRVQLGACSDTANSAYRVVDKEANDPQARRKILKRICEVRSAE